MKSSLSNRFIISFLFLLLVLISGCSFSRYNELKPIKEITLSGNEIPAFLNYSNQKALFKSAINVYGNYLSGLMFFKEMEDSSVRVVLVTELGIKLFDFEFKYNDFKVHFCIEPLNKSYILNLIRDDFSLLINKIPTGSKALMLSDYNSRHKIYKLENEESSNYYFFENQTGRFEKMENASLWLRNVEIKSSKDSDTLEIDHCNFDINIKLIKINNKDEKQK